jgi:drug/metabolite transporter (DMT)-like permease
MIEYLSHHSIPRYAAPQIYAVLLITFGIILSTYASSQSLNQQKAAHNIKIDESKPDIIRWIIGISMLIFALVVSALMGIYQEKLYANYGKHPDEALFYLVRSFPKSSVVIFICISASAFFAIIRHCWEGYLSSCSIIQSIK